MTVGQFFKKNIVVIVMVPALIGAHYGWYKLQHVDSLVSEEDRNKLPITKLHLIKVEDVWTQSNLTSGYPYLYKNTHRMAENKTTKGFIQVDKMILPPTCECVVSTRIGIQGVKSLSLSE